LNLGGVFTGGPEIQISVDSANLVSNVSEIDFGTSNIGVPVVKTFTVSNVGVVPLTLGTVTLPSGFTLVAGATLSTLAPGQGATFVVRMSADVKGAVSGTLALSNNDADEG